MKTKPDKSVEPLALKPVVRSNKDKIEAQRQAEARDRAAKAEQLSAKGVEFAKPPKSEPWGVMAIMKDSEGNQIVLSTSR